MRFKGHTHWTEIEPDGTLNIPALYVPGWHLEAVEASTAALVYEGLQNFRNLEHLKVIKLLELNNMILIFSIWTSHIVNILMNGAWTGSLVN